MSTACQVRSSHSSSGSTAVKMDTRTILVFFVLSSAVSVIYGLSLEEVRGKREIEDPTEKDCARPPMRGHGHECCRVPKERIWGDLKSSIHMCLKKFKPGHKPMNQEMTESEEAVTPTNDGSPGTTPRPTDPSHGYHGPQGRPWKKPLSERIKELFTSMYKVVKNTFDALWQTVVIITDHFPHHQNDSCFMECVFEDQGFLLNKLVNKLALIERLDTTLEKNEQWHKVAVTAVEVCYQSGFKTDTNSTCQSGSEEIFRCIFKNLFFNCPNWSQNEYCTSLKKFYEKCPNGPPPEMSDSHPTSMPEETETYSTTESEKYSEE